MSILIAYVTKGGAAKECAEALAEAIGGCTLCDLDAGSPDISGFDTVILGTGVRIGSVYKPYKKFVDANLSQLLKKKVALFFCCIMLKDFEKMVTKNVPAELRSAAFRVSALGGKPVFGGKKNNTWMLRDEVAAFADAAKGLK